MAFDTRTQKGIHWRGSSVLLAAIMTCGLLAGLARAPAQDRIDHGPLVTEGIPPVPEALSERIAHYRDIAPTSFADWAQNSRSILVRRRAGDTFQFHKISRPLARRRQLTFFNEPVRGGLYAPPGGPRGFLFLKDRGGDERYQLFFFDETIGEPRQITDGSERVLNPRWSKDGRLICWTGEMPDSDMRRIYIAPSNDPSRAQVILEARGYWVPVDWSPDNRILLVEHHRSATESTLHMVYLLEGEITLANPLDRPVRYNDARFSADGSAIFYLSDEAGDFRGITRYEIARERKTNMTGDIPWDVERLDLSRDGRYLVFSVNENGRSRLHLRSLPDNRPLPVPDLPDGVMTGLTFSPDSRSLGFGLESAAAPKDVWSYDIRARRLRRWSAAETGALKSSRFVKPETFRYPTFDMVEGERREIPAFYFRPPGEGPFPVLIYIHGGPESQYRPRFRADFQYWLLEQGIAVVAPNVRGSSGYGRTYLSLDDTVRREDAVRDIDGVLDWIAARPELDKDRVAVYGTSYGGYMVLASMIAYGDRLAGGLDLFGISNFVTFLENTSPYRQAIRRAEYGDERDPEMRRFLQRISPLTRADRLRKPLFIVQGRNDPRVPESESEQLLRAVKENETPVWYLLAKNEGHGFQRKSNRDYLAAATVMFLDSILMADE